MIPTGLALELPSRIYFADYGPEAVAQVGWKSLVRNFSVLPREEVPPQYKSGVTFSTVSVHPKFYIPWLKSELDARGVKFVRKHIASLEQAAALAGPTGIVVNATALGARSIIGIEDLEVYPIKGQGIIVQNPKLKQFFAVIDKKIPNGHMVYAIPRPGDDTTILGGTYFEDVWDTSIDYSVSREIFARNAEVIPELNSPETKILSHRAGLRPARRGGPRVEAEWVDLPLKGHLVPERSSVERKLLCIHAYGLGGAGYQRSWGVAEEVRDIIKPFLLPGARL